MAHREKGGKRPKANGHCQYIPSERLFFHPKSDHWFIFDHMRRLHKYLTSTGNQQKSQNTGFSLSMNSADK